MQHAGCIRIQHLDTYTGTDGYRHMPTCIQALQRYGDHMPSECMQNVRRRTGPREEVMEVSFG